MGSIMSAISDDIDMYLFLCNRYGESPQYSHGSEDCYGDHASALRARLDAEQAVGKATEADLRRKAEDLWRRLEEAKMGLAPTTRFDREVEVSELPESHVSSGMTLKIHAASHLDHGLTPAHMDFILKEFRGSTEFFIKTVVLPIELASLRSGIYGPIVGDSPVLEAEVTYKIRGTRRCASRIVQKSMRLSRQLTVVGGPHEDEPCILYTAYGGPAAPREPGDPGIASWEELVKAREFWVQHALSHEV